MHKKIPKNKINFLFVFGILSSLYLLTCDRASKSKSSPAPQKDNSITAQLLQIEQAKLKAINQIDTLQFKSLLDPGYEWIDAYGKVLDQKQILQILKTRLSSSVQELHTIKKTKIQLYNQNSVAIIRGEYVIEKREKNGTLVLNNRFSDTYIMDSNNTWKLIHSQHTRIKE